MWRAVGGIHRCAPLCKSLRHAGSVSLSDICSQYLPWVKILHREYSVIKESVIISAVLCRNNVGFLLALGFPLCWRVQVGCPTCPYFALIF